MKLTIVGFQDIPHLQLSLEEGSIVHITGESGCGKSSIFEAIYWCLFGKVNDVEQRGAENQRMYVRCKFSDFVVRRQRHPKLLSVKRGELCYENTIAQHKITEYLSADKEGWLASSYIMQGEPHFLLTLPPKERYNVLLRMSMKGEDAELYLRKLADIIKKVSEELLKKKQEYDLQLAKYNRRCENSDVNNDDILSKEEEEETLEIIEELKTDILRLRTELISSKEKEIKYQTLSHSLHRSRSQYEALESYKEEEFESLLASQSFWETKDKLQKQLRSLETEIARRKASLVDIPIVEIEVTSETIAEARYLESSVAKNRTLCRELSINYDEVALAQEKERIQATLAAEEEKALHSLAFEKLKERDSLVVTETPTQDESELVKSLLSQKEKINALQKEREAELRALQETNSASLEREKIEIAFNFEERRREVCTQGTTKLALLKNEFHTKDEELKSALRKTKDEISALTATQEIHSCPYCEGSLRFVAGKFEKSDARPFDAEKFSATKRLFQGLQQESASITENFKKGKSSLLKEEQSLLSEIQTQERKQQQALSQRLARAKEEASDKINSDFKERLRQIDISISEIETSLSQWKSIRSKRERIATLERDLTSLPTPPQDYSPKRRLTTREVQTLKTRLKCISDVVIVDAPLYSSETLKKVLDKIATEEFIKKEESEVAELRERLGELGDVVQVRPEEVIDYRQSLREKQFLEKQLSQQQNDLNEIGKFRSSKSLENRCSRIEHKLESYEVSLQRSKDATLLAERHQALQDLYEEHEYLHQRHLKFQKFHLIVKGSIEDALMGIISKTNSLLSSMCKRLFLETIGIRLSTEKLLKSGGKKQEINLVIHYKGGFVHNFKKGLSGGEKARINTALSLALASYTNSRVLILDEAISFLNDKIAQCLMEVVRENSDRIVLLASQNCSSGLVDHVVEFESLLKP